MGDLLQFPKSSSYDEIAEYLIVLTDDIMARNKEAISWVSLSLEDCAEIDRINKHWLVDFNKAAKMGRISQEYSAKIKAFTEWEESLRRFEFED